MTRIFSLPAVLGAALGAIMAFGSSPAAADQRIECPLDRVRTEITSSLPSGWWQTPQVGRLTDVKTDEIGGKPTLMCGYGAFGTTVYVMREAPRRHRCSVRGAGFDCVRRGGGGGNAGRGVLEVPQTWTFDLDRGQVGGPRRNVDFWFRAVSANERYLEPQNGAQIAIVGLTSIGERGCRRIRTYTSQRLPISIMARGLYFCVKTSRGRFAEFRVNRAAGRSPGTLVIAYRTWGR